MALDLSGKNSAPYIEQITGQGTTWLEVTFPPWARFFTPTATAAIYVAFHDAADGGTTGSTPKKELSASDVMEFRLSISLAKKVYVAAKTGTADIDLLIEP